MIAKGRCFRKRLERVLVCSNMVRRRKRFFWHFTRIASRRESLPLGVRQGGRKPFCW